MSMFGFLAGPLGWLLQLINSWVNNYFLAIFLFTFIMRILLFPLQLQSQKKQADRIRLAPRLERLQKKYKNDPKKLQAKQQALYEKEGVSLTGGCLPMIITMILLFGIIDVIYRPLTYMANDIPNDVVNAAVSAATLETYTKDDAYIKDNEKNPTVATITLDGEEWVIDLTTKVQGDKYYGEMKMMNTMDQNRDDILKMIQKETDCTAEQAEKYLTMIASQREQFQIGKYSLLEKPWTGWSNISVLWLIPLISGLTAMLTSMLSMHFSKQGMSAEKQPGQGCSNGMMMFFMPLFSLYIAFTVPGGVGIYWIFSNLFAIVQTLVLNSIYNPKKIREQAEIEYEERRRRRAEEKKNKLADARRRDDERERAEDEVAAAAAQEKNKQGTQKNDKKKEKKLNLEVGKVKIDENETDDK